MATSLPRDKLKHEQIKTFQKKQTKQNEVKGRRLRLGLVFCHGAHTREEQEHANEDVNSNNSLNFDKQGRARHGKADMDRNTGSNE